MMPVALERAPRGGIAEAKANLSSIVSRVEQGDGPFVIMRYNKPVAVIEAWEQRGEPQGHARGSLSAYASGHLREQEEGAFARAMAVKHANAS